MRSQVVHRARQDHTLSAGDKNKPMRWGLQDGTRMAIYIGMLTRSETGLKSRCRCPSCGAQLQAVNAGRPPDIHSPPGSLGQFFRHDNGLQRENCLPAVARLVALQLLVESDELDLPPPTVSQSHCGPSGDFYTASAIGEPYRARVRHRHWIDEQSATLTLDDGRKILVQMRASSGHAEGGSWDAVLTIQVSDPEVASWTAERILKQIQLGRDFTCWDRHWQHAELNQLAVADAVAQAARAGDALPHGLSYEGKVPPASESMLHWVVKNLLSKVSRIRVPSATQEVSAQMPGGEITTRLATVPATVLEVRDVRLEHRLPGMVPDVICLARDIKGGDDMELLIEVAVTHKVDEVKLQKVADLGLACIELDATKFTVGGRVRIADLSGAIFSDTQNKRWLHHPLLDAAVASTKAELNRQADSAQRAIDEQQARITWINGRTERELTEHYLSALGNGGADTPLSIGGHNWDFSDFAQALANRGWESAADDVLAGADGILRCIHAIKSSARRSRSGWLANTFELFAQFLESKTHQRFASLVCIAFKVYAPSLTANERIKLEAANARIKASLAGRELTFARPDTHDKFVAHIFPEMGEALAKPFGTRRFIDEARRAENVRLMKEREDLRRIEHLREQQRQQEQEQADLQRQISAACRFGWAKETGFTRDPDQILSIVAVKKLVRNYGRLSIDAPSLIRSAWHSRANGVDLETWFREQGPGDAIHVSRISALLNTTWLAI